MPGEVIAPLVAAMITHCIVLRDVGVLRGVMDDDLRMLDPAYGETYVEFPCELTDYQGLDLYFADQRKRYGSFPFSWPAAEDKSR